MENVENAKEEGGLPPLPSPPAVVPPDVKPELPVTPKYSIMTRKGTGRSGQRIPLMANHFKVSLKVPDAVFYQYSVCFHCLSSCFVGSLSCILILLLCTAFRFLLLQKIVEM